MSKQERVDRDWSDRADDGSLELERLLGMLVPARPALDVGTVLAEVVARSDARACAARRQVWLWRGVATALAASMALIAWIQPAPPPPAEHIVWMPAAAASRVIATGIDAPTADAPNLVTPRAPGSCAYLVLRQQVLARGVDALRDAPAPATITSPPPDDSPFRPLGPNGGGILGDPP
jgi:hypothetical protein